MVNIAIDIALLALIAFGCWRGYQQRALWFTLPVHLLLRLGRRRSYWMQLLIYGPFTIGGLLLCHWINTHGWHASAAGGIVIAMTIGLEAMRIVEEDGKRKREPCDTESKM